ncbi:hypothetical protein YC2023_061603 [Brassica napus]
MGLVEGCNLSPTISPPPSSLSGGLNPKENYTSRRRRIVWDTTTRTTTVLRLLYGRRTVEYEMYDFKSDSWRDLAVTCDWIIEDYREGLSLKGNNYFVAERKKELVEMGEYLVCFDFTSERFIRCLDLDSNSRKGDSVTLSPVREEQLAVLLYSADRYEVEIRITTKIEANEMTWINFLKVDVKPFTGIIWECLRFGIGSLLVDEKKKVALIWDNYCNQAYVTGEDNYFKQVAPGGSTYLPRVFSYVPSLVQIQKGPEQAGGKRKVRY